jgi:hypothetical protein
MRKRYDGIKYKLGCGDVHTEWQQEKIYGHIDEFFTFENIVMGPENKAKVFNMIIDEADDVCGEEPEEVLKKDGGDMKY